MVTDPVVHLKMPVELHQRAREVAACEDRSIAYIVRRALQRELEQLAQRAELGGQA